jgi:hypothetical protein
MLPALIVCGVAATYLHKKFPRATEAVATGIVKGTALGGQEDGADDERALFARRGD